jgi:hypothetical protein
VDEGAKRVNYFVFTTFGEMTVQDLINECHQQSWAPLLIARPKEAGQPTLVPCFPTRALAAKFVERNMSKKQLHGSVTLDVENLAKLHSEWIEARGWKIEYLDHPRRLTNTHQFDVEVLELSAKPDINALHNEHGTASRPLAIGN